MHPILIVEDHEPTRRALAWVLRKSGYAVVEAGSVREGIAALDGQAVALLDLNLPDGTGTEVLKHIREQHHHTRVAVISATADERLLDEARQLEPEGLFAKPVDVMTLLAWVREQVR